MVEPPQSIGGGRGVGLAQPARAWTFTCGLIVRIEEGAFAEGQAAATDAPVEGRVQCDEWTDATGRRHCPVVAQVSPFALGRRAIERQRSERGGDSLKGEPDALPCGNNCEPSEGVARKLAFVACCPAVLMDWIKPGFS